MSASGRTRRWRRDAGFTLFEMLITLAILGVILTISLSSLSAQSRSSRVQNAALSAGTMVRAAVSEARRTSSDITLSMSGTTLQVKEGTVLRRSFNLGMTPTLTCRPPAEVGLPTTTPCSWPMTINAPHGTSAQDFELVFTAGSGRRAQTRTVQVSGPAAVVTVR